MHADPDHLVRMLSRLKLTAIRNQLDSLLDEVAQRELATGRLIANGEVVLLPGPLGVGKTHLVALGWAVILAGCTILFVQSTVLVAALAQAHGEGQLEEKLTQFAKLRLLIVDV